MALTAEQTAALETIADALSGADAKDVADGIKAALPDAYQTAFRVGYGTAKGEFEPKVKEANTARETAEAERDEAKATADNLSGKDADFAAEKTRLEQAAQTAKDAKEAAEKAADARIRAVYETAQDSQILAGLVSQGVDKDYAQGAVLPSLRSRRRVDALPTDDNPQPVVSFLDADGVPLSGGLDAFVTTAAASVPAKFKVSAVDAGGGASNGSGGSTGSAAVKQIQAEVDARYGANDAQKSARERMGLAA